MRRMVQGRAGLALTFILGLVIATAGSATAAKLITGKQIKDGSITKTDLSKGVRTELAKSGRAGARGRAGLQGADGPKGEQGPGGQTGPSTGPAGGDLTGFYPNPKVRRIEEFGIKQQQAPPAMATDCEITFDTYCGSVASGNYWDRPIDGSDGGFLVYTVDLAGFVEFNGAVRQVGSYVANLTVLPVDRRPAVTHRVRITHVSNADDAAYLTIQKDGHVQIFSNSTGPGQIYDLTGVRFRIGA